jgi:hypothetical protein
MMNDTPLVTGIMHALSKKSNLQIIWRTPEHLEWSGEIARDNPSIVILNPDACSSQSPECLIGFFSNPNVLEVLMINPETNLVQVFKKQQITLADKEDFAKLF